MFFRKDCSPSLGAGPLIVISMPTEEKAQLPNSYLSMVLVVGA